MLIVHTMDKSIWFASADDFILEIIIDIVPNGILIRVKEFAILLEKIRWWISLRSVIQINYIDISTTNIHK